MAKNTKRSTKNQKGQLVKQSSLTVLIGVLINVVIYFASPFFLSSSSEAIASSNEPIQLYSNQLKDNLSQITVDAINQANQSVVMVIYALTDKAVLNSLSKKCQEGVPVYIVCDAKASPGITKHLPNAQIIRRAGKGLTHQKIVVIDEKRTLIGSANFTKESLELHGNLVVKIDNEDLSQRLVRKIRSMDEENGADAMPHCTATIADQNMELCVLPDDRDAAKRVIALIRTAKKSIKVAMFTWTRQDFTKELIEASKRGVKVEVAIDRYSGSGASAKVVQMLSKEGIPVHMNKGRGLLHHKFALIDEGEILVNGSANWTASAFDTNDDCFVIVRPLNEEQKKKMNKLWDQIKKEAS